MFEIDDVIEHIATGQRRMVTAITPAGAAGTRESDGPTYHAVMINAYGQSDPRGHSAAIWSGSISYPTRNYRKVHTS